MLLELFLISVAFTPSVRSRIHVIDGKEAEAHSIPWSLSLQKCRLRMCDHSCGASLLAVPCMENESNIALTAAHCLPHPNKDVHRDVSTLSVVAGAHDLAVKEEGEVIARVAVAISHEDSRKDGKTVVSNDIAILKLETPIQFSQTIKPIYLPEHSATVNQRCQIAGWGLTSLSKDGGKTAVWEETTKLQELDVRVEAGSICRRDPRFAEFYNDTTIIYVARVELGPKKNWGNGCKGDSGGALACVEEGNRVVIHGVRSGGRPLCDGHGLYSRVSEKLPWIEEKLKTLGICPGAPTSL